MTPFDRLGRFVVRRAWWVVIGWVVLLLVAIPFARPGARPAERRRLHLRRPRVGAGEGPPRDAARRPAVGARRRLLEPDPGGRQPGVRGRRGRGRRRGRRPRRTWPASCRTSSRRTRCLPIATPPTTSSSSTCRPTTHPTRCRSCANGSAMSPGLEVALAGGPAFYGDVQTVSEADLQRSELISLPLAALALVVRVRLAGRGRGPARGRRRGGHRRAGGHLRRRLDHADEHLRAQPRDAARARARAWTTRC